MAWFRRQGARKDDAAMAENTWLVVGLGNPGAQYAGNRHNVGQLTLDELASRIGATFKSHKTPSRVAEGFLRPGGPKLVLAKPNSYMNTSGGPVSALLKFYSLPVDRLVVVHDELDIPFDTERLKIICNAGITVVSNQVQFSLVDRRPEAKMASFCQRHGITLLTYGTVCGGLLSERFLGQPEPRHWDLPTASAQKYKHMIDAWGDWALFQQLLTALKRIADKRSVSIANVAVRAILDKPAVAGVIVGARLGAAPLS